LAVLVDDLVTKGTREPYRMFTSRAEHRLLLREGNADERLTPLGREIGLVGDEQWRTFTEKQNALRTLRKGLRSIVVRPDASARALLDALRTSVPGKSITLEELARRPELSLRDLAAFWPVLAEADQAVLEELENQVKYAGYLVRQQDLANQTKFLENVLLPPDLDYDQVAGLSREVREKLARSKPLSLGQAGRISGVTPAAVGCLRIHLRKIKELL
jgi:tRNA uridine 5-carboxymethylaminomethyl modification enzyme